MLTITGIVEMSATVVPNVSRTRLVVGVLTELTTREFATKTVFESAQENPGACGQGRPGEAFLILPSK